MLFRCFLFFNMYLFLKHFSIHMKRGRGKKDMQFIYLYSKMSSHSMFQYQAKNWLRQDPCQLARTWRLLGFLQCHPFSHSKPHNLLCNGPDVNTAFLLWYRTGLSKLFFFFVKAWISDLKLCGPSGLYCNHSTLLWHKESSHREYTSKWVWLCSNKTLFKNRWTVKEWMQMYSNKVYLQT